MKNALLKPLAALLPAAMMLWMPLYCQAGDYHFADVNRDGEVNLSDINAVIDVILGNATQPIEPSNKTFTANGVSFTMVKVDGGTFEMGATDNDPEALSDEYPTRMVSVSDYYIGQTEVTQELWEAVMGTRPSVFTGGRNPVERVSWDECREFISRLNALTGQKFRFPSEAEWEFAARGGNKSHGYKYSGSNNLDEVGWWGYQIGGNNSSYSTQPVAQLAPNELGIYDMSGNVLEWCNDWYGIYPVPTLQVSTGMILFEDIPYPATQTTASFTIKGNRLSDDVYINVEGSGFSVSSQVIGVKEANSHNNAIQVTYSGPRDLPAEGVITISSKNAKDCIINLRYHCPSLEILADEPLVLPNPEDGHSSTSAVIMAIGRNLQSDVTLSADKEGFNITPSSLSPVNGAVGSTITVTYSGNSTQPDTTIITVRSANIPDQYITVIAHHSELEVVSDNPLVLPEFLDGDSLVSDTIKVHGRFLSGNVNLNISGDNFSISPAVLVPIDGIVDSPVVISYSGNSAEPVSATITIKSAGLPDQYLTVTAQKTATDTTSSSFTKPMMITAAHETSNEYEGYIDIDPSGPTYGSYHIMRGGAWNSQSRFCRVSYRYARESSYKNFILGLRLAM